MEREVQLLKSWNVNAVQPTKRTSLTSCRAYFKLAENIAPEKIVLGFSGYTDGIEEIHNSQ